MSCLPVYRIVINRVMDVSVIHSCKGELFSPLLRCNSYIQLQIYYFIVRALPVSQE